MRKLLLCLSCLLTSSLLLSQEVQREVKVKTDTIGKQVIKQQMINIKIDSTTVKKDSVLTRLDSLILKKRKKDGDKD